jgi:ABC-2 type transport system permease protein
MNKTFIAAQWEYIEKVKTKTFIISLFVTPLIILVFTAGPAFLLSHDEVSTKPIGFADTSGIYFSGFNESMSQYNIKENIPAYIIINTAISRKPLNDIIEDGDRQLLNNSLAGYLIVLNGGTDSVKLKFRSAGLYNPDEMNRFERAFQYARLTAVLRGKVSSSELLSLSDDINISTEIINKEGKKGESDFMSSFFSSLILVMLLLMTIISIGGMLIRSMLEEKSNRLIEILLSSCTPGELLTGKIIGLSALGLTQILVWGIMGIVFTGTSLLPAETFSNILPMLLFFFLGFLFYVSLYVGIGSVVTTEQEAQQLNSYLSILLFVPVIFALPAIQNPDSVLIRVLSFIPFTSPAIMLFRFNTANIPLSEIIVIATIMVISIMVTIMITSRIFRIGILSYGKRPALKEIRQWINET